MIPPFDELGRLPPGIHWAEWEEFAERYGTSQYRRMLLAGLKKGLDSLRAAYCRTAYIDGSFITDKPIPGDFDACWSVEGVVAGLLDPILLMFDNGRAAQKAKFYGEFFPAEIAGDATERTFLEFFQTDKETGGRKGIIALDLGRLP